MKDVDDNIVHRDDADNSIDHRNETQMTAPYAAMSNIVAMGKLRTFGTHRKADNE